MDHHIPFHEIPPKDEFDPEENSFSVDDTHVRVSCKSFSEFFCTTCKTTCQSTIRAFIFAHMRAWPRKNITTLEVKSFLCSYLFRIEDFKQVSLVDSSLSINLYVYVMCSVLKSHDSLVLLIMVQLIGLHP